MKTARKIKRDRHREKITLNSEIVETAVTVIPSSILTLSTMVFVGTVGDSLLDKLFLLIYNITGKVLIQYKFAVITILIIVLTYLTFGVGLYLFNKLYEKLTNTLN